MGLASRGQTPGSLSPRTEKGPVPRRHQPARGGLPSSLIFQCDILEADDGLVARGGADSRHQERKLPRRAGWAGAAGIKVI